MSELSQVLYSVGHSHHPSEVLCAILEAAAVRTLVDIRSHPYSPRHPLANQDALRAALAQRGITYHWAGRQLGGRRSARPDSAHLALPVDRRGFADYMQSDEFARAAVQLQRLAQRSVTAILCAEADPDHCHRSLIADYLMLKGVQVVHLLADGSRREHRVHAGARCESTALIYDRHVTPALW